MVSRDSRIVIVGGGVFGLSTSLHLARAGYKNITVFDRCPLKDNKYDPSNGCDGASADINKIFRATYGVKEHYQNLALEAREIWLSWNAAIRSSPPSSLPSPLTPDDELLINCGLYHIGYGKEMQAHYAENLTTMASTSPSFRTLQFIKHDPADAERIKALGPQWEKKFHHLDDLRSGDTHGFLDTACGITLADKACIYAHHLCMQAGVKFIFGNPQGEVTELLYSSTNPSKIAGIRTADTLTHPSDLLILATGAWTTSLLPSAHRTIESTGGTVLFIDIPPTHTSLLIKFHPSNFPITRFVTGSGDTAYEGSIFPLTSANRLKFGFRARKFTNFEPHPTKEGLKISTPRTRYTKHPIRTVPLHGLKLMKETVGNAFPELKEIGFTDSRLCWYTDSIDNEFVIDYVPGSEDSLFICTGGSGHGFKFLPVLGKYVQMQIERRESVFTEKWRWRERREGEVCNGLGEGEGGPREMKGLKMANRDDFKFNV